MAKWMVPSLAPQLAQPGTSMRPSKILDTRIIILLTARRTASHILEWEEPYAKSKVLIWPPTSPNQARNLAESILVVKRGLDIDQLNCISPSGKNESDKVAIHRNTFSFNEFSKGFGFGRTSHETFPSILSSRNAQEAG
jgi:hypothetical protein